MIRLLVAEDQTLLRGALVEIFSREPDLHVVVECSCASQILPALEAHDVNVAVLDIEYGDGNALDLLDRIVATGVAGIVMLTVFGRPGYVKRAGRHDLVSFVLKDTAPRELVDVIRQSAAGVRVVDPQLALLALREGDSPLTARETEVLAASRNIHGSADLARALHLSPGTVRNTLSAAMRKLRASGRVEAARIAEQNGWL